MLDQRLEALGDVLNDLPDGPEGPPSPPAHSSAAVYKFHLTFPLCQGTVSRCPQGEAQL